MVPRLTALLGRFLPRLGPQLCCGLFLFRPAHRRRICASCRRRGRVSGRHRPAGTFALLKKIVSVGAWTMVSRLTGLIRDLVTATILGAGPAADAFFVAFRLPNHF